MLLGIKIEKFRIIKIEMDAPSSEMTETDITPKGRYTYIDTFNGLSITANGIDTAKRYYKKVYAYYKMPYFDECIVRLTEKTKKYYIMGL